MAFGGRKFDRCGHRKLDFSQVELMNAQTHTRRPAYLATLHCPNESADGLKGDKPWPKKIEAAAELKRTVVQIACGSCVLYKFNKIQIIEERTAVTKAMAALANAESDRLEAAHRYNELVASGKEVVDGVNARILKIEPSGDITPLTSEVTPLPPPELP